MIKLEIGELEVLLHSPEAIRALAEHHDEKASNALKRGLEVAYEYHYRRATNLRMEARALER